jgi:hypothetical protein
MASQASRVLPVGMALVAACACSSSYVTRSGGAGGTGGLGVGSGSGPVDAGEGGFDAGQCVPITVPALPKNGGPACPMDAGACFPADVTKFAPTWVPPVSDKLYPGICDATQIAAAYTACFGASQSIAACSAYKQLSPANMDCLACLTTDVSSQRYGAQITVGRLATINYAGCIAAAEPCNQACAAAVLADLECDFAACSPTIGPCAVTDQASLAENSTCRMIAESTCGCSGFSGAYEPCFNKTSTSPRSTLRRRCATSATRIHKGFSRRSRRSFAGSSEGPPQRANLRFSCSRSGTRRPAGERPPRGRLDASPQSC